MDIFLCLQKLLPGWMGYVKGNVYSGIVPGEAETRPTPSLAELQAIWPTVEIERDAMIQAEIEREQKRMQSIATNLPSRIQVHNTINNINDLTEAKDFLLKLTDVVYWLAKNTEQ